MAMKYGARGRGVKLEKENYHLSVMEKLNKMSAQTPLLLTWESTLPTATTMRPLKRPPLAITK